MFLTMDLQLSSPAVASGKIVGCQATIRLPYWTIIWLQENSMQSLQKARASTRFIISENDHGLSLQHFRPISSTISRSSFQDGILHMPFNKIFIDLRSLMPIHRIKHSEGRVNTHFYQTVCTLTLADNVTDRGGENSSLANKRPIRLRGGKINKLKEYVSAYWRSPTQGHINQVDNWNSINFYLLVWAKLPLGNHDSNRDRDPVRWIISYPKGLVQGGAQIL